MTYPAPRAAPPLFETERDLKGKDQSMSPPPMTAPPAAAGRGLTCSGSRTHPSPKRSQVGVHVVLLPKFLDSEQVYESRASDPLSEQDQSLEVQDAAAHQPIDCHLDVNG